MAGYAIAPGATNVATLLFTTLGTGLCIASANTFNQWVESPYDAQMARTRTRVLVKHSISPLHAFSVGVLSGGAGVGMLLNYVNPTVAWLGLFNIILYSGIYTPMKRYHIANTWVGSVVGAIPPLMGWAACTGSVDMPSYLLALLMFAWQFPHFNSLAWNLRSDYAKAGYQMMSVTNPPLNSRVSLRYSLALIPISIAFPLCNLTSWWFALDSNLVNLYMLVYAWKFHKSNDDKSARSLFFSSLIHLPLIFALMLIHKESSDKPITYEEFINNCKSALNYLKGIKEEKNENLLE
ncbi:protoheme IX farnesyltransferase [Conidiobolus coronatus NRRL 28638]|uniref:Protoheme IX farnesyltransferase, mitochondrial n=1 Tax=Conidiobolus coronatus (strain ATCC 28846 / CBS 209.66 / NRRL 28638) TaxID=796925 RepID=A0A137P6Y9_CONC2|nr:protoheme IX farnesyltransferase [Conidiobolus coronatus NRRL 28638]|eukprot:KXN70787.1 protoheme IX farnesyltransferase [Conidiobolus coronatus NRRL 28638]